MSGAPITGLAISGMHYAGMAAVRIPAQTTGMFLTSIASVCIGVLASALALDLAVRRNDLRAYSIAAGLLAFGIISMHFTAMSAVVFVPDPTVRISGVVIAPGAVAAAVAASVVLIMGLGMIGAIVDYHLANRAMGEAARQRAHIEELEKTKRRLEKRHERVSKRRSPPPMPPNDAKSRFPAAMSHELRTPLNAVIGFADLFRMEACGPLGDARYREYAEDIRAGGAHLLRLINEILEIASLNSGGIALREEDIDVTAKIARVVRIMLPDATKASVHLDFRIEANLLQLRADPQKLWQMLINLISNAIKFTPAGGEVLILAGMHEDGMAITVKDAGIAQI